MNYPHWEVPILGGGMVIALVATIHVLIAHFAVGAGFFVAFTESRIGRRDDPLLRDFLLRFGKFLILFAFVAGAVTGVGIWFSIGLVSPRATSILIHNYVWGWAAEWCLFLIEIAAGYCYYFSAGRLGDRKRRWLAWTYAWAAWGSLVIIVGIISFMLTPGRWIETFEFWDGFFNPTYVSSVLLRTISSLALAGIFVAIVANGSRRYSREEAKTIINHAAWFMAPLVLMLPLSVWYFSSVPEQALHLIMGGAIAMQLFLMFGIAASTLVGFYAFIGLIWNKRYVNMETAVLLLAIAFIATGSMEFVREGIRKPWLIYGYLYSSGWTPDEAPVLNEKGIIAANPWVLPAGVEVEDLTQLQLGRAVYNAQCSQCHVLGGVNDVQPLIAGWDRDLVWQNLQKIHQLKVFMPPLVGTDQERRALSEFLVYLTPGWGEERKEIPELPAPHLDQPQAGELAKSPTEAQPTLEVSP